MKIFLLPVGSVEESIIKVLGECITTKFTFETRVLEPLPEPEYAFDPVRKQYNSIMILRKAVEDLPPDTVKVLAVTEKDIFIPMLTFVYGQAQLGGIGAIISLARLRQEFSGLIPNPTLFVARALKEALHELGHAFGLTHCLDKNCTMSLSTNILQIDAKGGDFCESCQYILEQNIDSICQREGINLPTED